jgi:hypothetical protein
MDSRTDTARKGEVGRRLLQKLLMPIVATAASAAAGYAAKRAPQVLEKKILPKLRDVVGSAVQEVPERAKSAAGDAGDVAERLAERVTNVVGQPTRRAHNEELGRTVSAGELQRRQSEREKHRSARRKASR